MNDYIPAGYWHIEAWCDGKHVIILGRPDDESLSDEDAHNCDEMGCGSGKHVLARVTLKIPATNEKTLHDELMDAAFGRKE